MPISWNLGGEQKNVRKRLVPDVLGGLRAQILSPRVRPNNTYLYASICGHYTGFSSRGSGHYSDGITPPLGSPRQIAGTVPRARVALLLNSR